MNPKAKRIIRSIKYFFVFLILVSLIICLIVIITPGAKFNQIFLPMSEGGLFKDGAWWQMLLLFALLAAVYPGLVFVKKEVMIEGDFEDHRDKIMQEFENSGYEKVDEDSETVSFRLKNRFTRFMRAYEDKVTITKGEAPLILSGNRKEILRLASHIEYVLRQDADTPDDPYDFSNTTPGNDSGSSSSNDSGSSNTSSSGNDSGSSDTSQSTPSSGSSNTSKSAANPGTSETR